MKRTRETKQLKQHKEFGIIVIIFESATRRTGTKTRYATSSTKKLKRATSRQRKKSVQAAPPPCEQQKETNFVQHHSFTDCLTLSKSASSPGRISLTIQFSQHPHAFQTFPIQKNVDSERQKQAIKGILEEHFTTCFTFRPISGVECSRNIHQIPRLPTSGGQKERTVERGLFSIHTIFLRWYRFSESQRAFYSTPIASWMFSIIPFKNSAKR